MKNNSGSGGSAQVFQAWFSWHRRQTPNFFDPINTPHTSTYPLNFLWPIPIATANRFLSFPPIQLCLKHHQKQREHLSLPKLAPELYVFWAWIVLSSLPGCWRTRRGGIGSSSSSSGSLGGGVGVIWKGGGGAEEQEELEGHGFCSSWSSRYPRMVTKENTGKSPTTQLSTTSTPPPHAIEGGLIER